MAAMCSTAPFLPVKTEQFLRRKGQGFSNQTEGAEKILIEKCFLAPPLKQGVSYNF